MKVSKVGQVKLSNAPAAFAELHKGKASTLMGRALQSLLIEPLECAKPHVNSGRKDLHCQNL